MYKRQKERREIYASLEDGSCKMVIGTHALIQEKVQYKNLALVITDEQHRFGVRQRTALAEKGEPPNVLAVSYTHLDVYKRQRLHRPVSSFLLPGAGSERRRGICLRKSERKSIVAFRSCRADGLV